MTKADEKVRQNVEHYEQFNNYILTASKTVYDAKGKRYNVNVRLQLFTDDEGNVQLIREI